MTREVDEESARCRKQVGELLSHVDSSSSKDSNANNAKKPCDNDLSQEFTPQIRWLDAIGLLYVHLGCLYGVYLLCTVGSFNTFLWLFATTYISGLGITAGVHRLWSHRAYKAKWPMRLLLILLFTMTGQRHVYAWALDHRVHHKYSETEADPHNAKRGFLFAHVGWLVLTPHPAVVEKRQQVDMSDLNADPLVVWQKKYYVPLFAVLALLLPVAVPVWWWGESWWTSLWVSFNARYCITLNIAFFVNSVAHMWGSRPYDRHISPAENMAVSIAALGEGWHNYHHVFPFDYKTGELGDYTFNLTTGFIDLCAKMGWAYDRKSVTAEMVRRRKEKSGDGTDAIWGWGDKDINREDFLELNYSYSEST